MFNSSLEIIIKARDEASQVVAGLTGKLKSMEPAFKKMATAGTVAFGALAAVAVSALKESAEAQADMANANQTLENSLKNLSGDALANFEKASAGASSGMSFLKEQMKSASDAALKLSFDDEAASKSFAKLFQVTKDTAEANRELQIAMDLARDKGISLEDATQKLVMVHSGATKQLKAEGIAIDENATSLENINSLSETYAGKALAYANTTQGAWDGMNERVNNLKQSIGDALAPALDKLVASVTPIIEKFTAWAEQNPELLSKIILIGGAVAALVAAVGTLGLILPTVITGFTLLLSPVGLIILAIGALIAVTVLIIKHWTEIKLFFAQVWEGIKIIFKEAIDGIIAYFQPLIDIVNTVVNGIEKVASGIGSVAKSVGKGVSNAVKSVTGKKAQGGSVSGGSTYLVGENGPELFTASSGGSITPNNKLGGGARSIVVNINGGNYLSEDASLLMGDYIIKSLQMQMRGS